MAAAGASVANTVLDCFDRVVALGTNYYIQNAAWTELQFQVSEGRRLLKAWDQAATNRGLSSNETLAGALSLARRTVVEEEEKMQKEVDATRKAKFFRKLKRTLLPEHVKLRVQLIVDCLRGIPQTLRTLQEVAETLDKTVTDRQPFLQTIPTDSRYVHFNDTEAAIKEAVEKDHGCPVVLFFGGAGTGKSTVVRNLGRYYEDKEGSSFDEVVYKDCGSKDKVDYTKFLYQLIQRLGETVVADFQTVKDQQRAIPLERQVKTLLSARKRLFILDDLIDEKFLLKMVNLSDIRPGGNVKFLVASQEPALCGSIDPVRLEKIPMQKLKQRTAREIIASHAGFSNRQIPSHLLGVVKKMIAQTDRNPLALAMLGGAIACIAGRDESLRNDIEQWGLLSENISEALQENKRPNALFQQPRYKRSLWATLELTIKEKLSTGCRNLLLVAHSFAEKSFPEAVIQLLFSRLRGVEGNFSVFKKELTQRNLITIRTEPTSGEKTWHLHSLQKLYIDSKMVLSRASVIDLLIGDGDIAASGGMEPGMDHIGNHHHHHTVVLTLCTLYLQKPLAQKAAAKTPAGPCLHSFARSCDNCILSERILAIARPVSDQWTLEDRERAREDFLSHIYAGPVADMSVQEFLPRCPICGDPDCICPSYE